MRGRKGFWTTVFALVIAFAWHYQAALFELGDAAAVRNAALSASH